jgi:hypothetical protein
MPPTPQEATDGTKFHQDVVFRLALVQGPERDSFRCGWSISIVTR